jgi:HAD superfamily hydrolase (TIGR01549 family)
MRFRVIILDFDGTIVESVGIKDAAFRDLFRDFPGHLDRIMSYHLANNATIRFEKFEHIYKNILKLPYTDETRDYLSKRFSSLVFKKIVGCEYVEGAIEFLEYFKGILPLYLVSMSPADELDRILNARNLKDYFKDVYSGTRKKTDTIRDILLRENAKGDEGILIGDANEDYLAARSAGVAFIGRDSKKQFYDASVPIYRDLKEILNHLRKE